MLRADQIARHSASEGELVGERAALARVRGSMTYVMLLSRALAAIGLPVAEARHAAAMELAYHHPALGSWQPLGTDVEWRRAYVLGCVHGARLAVRVTLPPRLVSVAGASVCGTDPPIGPRGRVGSPPRKLYEPPPLGGRKAAAKAKATKEAASAAESPGTDANGDEAAEPPVRDTDMVGTAAAAAVSGAGDSVFDGTETPAAKEPPITLPGVMTKMTISAPLAVSAVAPMPAPLLSVAMPVTLGRLVSATAGGAAAAVTANEVATAAYGGGSGAYGGGRYGLDAAAAYSYSYGYSDEGMAGGVAAGTGPAMPLTREERQRRMVGTLEKKLRVAPSPRRRRYAA